MSRIDELERYARVNVIKQAFSDKLERLKRDLAAVELDLRWADTSDVLPEEKKILVMSRLTSIQDEIALVAAEIKYREATAKWIKENLPRS